LKVVLGSVSNDIFRISAASGEFAWAKYLKEMNKEGEEGTASANTIFLSNESIAKLDSLKDWIESQSTVKVSSYCWVGSNFLSLSPAQIFQSQLKEMNPDAPDIFTGEDVDKFDADFWRLLMTSFSIEELSEVFDKGVSNGYPLRLQILVLPKDSAFKIHAHPNIEMIVGLVGELREAKLTDYYHSKKILERTHSFTPPDDNAVKDMMDYFEQCMVIEDEDSRSRFVDRVCTRQGKCCANQIGSVHQSYSSKNEGTIVFVLWSGCLQMLSLTTSREPKEWRS
jgi:hypothetical protein